jgi:hypothetical protein
MKFSFLEIGGHVKLALRVYYLSALRILQGTLNFLFSKLDGM